MSDVYGLIPHQTGYHYIILSEDYVVMFQRAADAWFEQSAKTDEDKEKHAQRRNHAVAKAYISSVLEQLSDKQFKSGVAESSIWVFLSFPEIESRIHGGVKMRTLKEAMKEMIEDGYVAKRPNPDRRFRTLIYHMNLKKYRTELNALPKRDNENNSAKMHDDTETENDSANLHRDSAKMHDDSANLHEDNANPHDGSCKNAPKNNNRLTTEETENNEEEGTLPAHESRADSGATAPAPAASHDSYSHTTEGEHEPLDTLHSHTDAGTHVRSREGMAQASSAQARNEQDQSHARGSGQLETTTSELDDETQKRPAVQLSTGAATSPQQRAKVEPRKQGRKGKKTEEPEPEPITLSPEAEKIWRAWCSLFTVEVELIPSNAKAAEKLVKPARVWCGKLHWTLAQWLKAIKDNAYAADNKGYYSKRGVKLFDIPRELEGWQSAKEHELATLAQAANPKPAEPKPIDPTLQALRQQRLQYAQGAMQ